MNFQDLYRKIAALDQPVSEAQVDECGGPMSMPGMSTPSTTPEPSLSLNLNAQGLDNIEQLMKLVTKVNPDAAPHSEPLTATPHAAEIGGGDEPEGPSSMSLLAPPMSDIIGSIDRIEAEPENDGKDIDGVDLGGGHEEPDADNMGGPSDHDADNMGDDDGMSVDQGDVDNDGDHDMDDHRAEKVKPGEDDEQEEAWANSPEGADGPYTKDTNYMIKDLAGGMNREKGQYKHSYKAGDNPMAMPESDLRASIRAELNSRLQAIKEGRDEGKPGKNFAKIAKSAGKHYGSKEAGERVAGAVRAKLAKAGKL